MQGVDLVAYFSLAEGDDPVIGSTSYVSTFGSYSFQFSSATNLALFEVRAFKTDPLCIGSTTTLMHGGAAGR